MRRLQRLILPVLLVGLLATPLLAAAPLATGKVTRVYDGDTIEVEQLGTVRLLGIDAPEWKASERDDYYRHRGIAPGRLREVAAAARELVTRETLGRVVSLESDREARDRHGRLLAYVYLPDGRMLNRLLLEKGLVAVYRRFDFDRKDEFIKAEREARHRRLGLWTAAEKE